MAASDVMERCSGGEMWFESQPLNWKIRGRTKALNGGQQTRPKTTDLLELVVAFLGHKGAEHWRVLQGLRRPLAGSWSGLEAPSFPFSITEITRYILDTGMRQVSTPQSKQPPIPAVFHPPSVFPAASLHWEMLVWSSATLCPKISPQNSRDTSLSYSRCACAIGEGESIKIPPWIVTACVLLSGRLSCQFLSENIHRAYGPRHPNHFRRCFQCGKEAQCSLDVRPVQENTAPHLSKDGKNRRKRFGANKTSFHLNIPTCKKALTHYHPHTHLALCLN